MSRLGGQVSRDGAEDAIDLSDESLPLPPAAAPAKPGMQFLDCSDDEGSLSPLNSAAALAASEEARLARDAERAAESAAEAEERGQAGAARQLFRRSNRVRESEE